MFVFSQRNSISPVVWFVNNNENCFEIFVIFSILETSQKLKLDGTFFDVH